MWSDCQPSNLWRCVIPGRFVASPGFQQVCQNVNCVIFCLFMDLCVECDLCLMDISLSIYKLMCDGQLSMGGIMVAGPAATM